MTDSLSMKSDLEALKKIQELDAQIYEFKSLLVELPLELRALDEAFESSKTNLNLAQSHLKNALLKQKEKEGNLSDKEASIKKFESQLAQVKTNKEYASLQSEISGIKADCSLLEEEIIKLIDQAEQLQKQVKSEEQRLSLIEKDLQSKKAVILQREKEANQKIAELTAQKKEIVKQINPKTAELYEKIVVRKNGIALSAIDGEECSACQMRLRPQQINEVQMGESVVSCEQCSRILYIP